MGHNSIFWCMQLGFNCIDNNNLSRLNEFVWFEHSEQSHVTSFVETQHTIALTSKNFEEFVWFEDSYSVNEKSEVEVPTIDVSETPFGLFDLGMYMSEDNKSDLKKEALKINLF